MLSWVFLARLSGGRFLATVIPSVSCIAADPAAPIVILLIASVVVVAAAAVWFYTLYRDMYVVDASSNESEQ